MTEERPSERQSDPGKAPETPKGGVAAWTSRVAGLGMLSEQSASHALGRGSDLLLLGAALILVTGREGLEFLRLILGREDVSSSERRSGPPD